MTTTTAVAITRKKLRLQIAGAQKEADAAKKEAKLAKLSFRTAKQKFKDARRTARKLRKELKALKAQLAGLAVRRTRRKPASPKPAARRPALVVVSVPAAPVEEAAASGENPPAEFPHPVRQADRAGGCGGTGSCAVRGAG